MAIEVNPKDSDIVEDIQLNDISLAFDDAMFILGAKEYTAQLFEGYKGLQTAVENIHCSYTSYKEMVFRELEDYKPELDPDPGFHHKLRHARTGYFDKHEREVEDLGDVIKSIKRELTNGGKIVAFLKQQQNILRDTMQGRDPFDESLAIDYDNENLSEKTLANLYNCVMYIDATLAEYESIIEVANETISITREFDKKIQEHID